MVLSVQQGSVTAGQGITDKGRIGNPGTLRAAQQNRGVAKQGRSEKFSVGCGRAKGLDKDRQGHGRIRTGPDEDK